MIGTIFAFGLAGLGFFILENLVGAAQVHIRPLTLLLFYLGLDEDLTPAFVLALFFGLLQDSYALTPFGLHLVGALFVVGVARFCRLRFMLRTPVPQVLASLAILFLQDGCLRLSLAVLATRPTLLDYLSYALLLEILGTAALAPLVFLLLGALKRLTGGIRPRSREVDLFVP
jgi:rod shape-determining protein MreD